MCSDGGAIANVGSYRVDIASNKKILLTVVGQAYGMTPWSFRAEGYGMSAILRLLYHFITYHRIQ